MRVIVIGGGISGLAAAYYIQKKGRETNLPVHLTIVERQARWGGKIATERVGGFVIEGGPDTFISTRPWALDLCRELDLENRLCGANPVQKNTYVLHQGRLSLLPEGLTMMVPTKFGPIVRTPLLSWSQKARLGLEFFLPPSLPNGDESLGNFISRRLGRHAYERLIEPLLSGIYAGDGDRLSLPATFPYLRELEAEHGGLIRGALALRRRRNGDGKNFQVSRSVFLTLASGLTEIVEALHSRLKDGGAELRVGTAAKELGFKDGVYHLLLENGERLQAEGLVLAAPAFAAGDLVHGLDPRLAVELRQIEYVSTGTISLAYRQSDLPRSLDGYGYIIPRREAHEALACTWSSTKFPHRAPEGFALIRIFVGRAGQQAEIAWDEASLLAIAKDEAFRTLGITAEPYLSRVYYWERAMPQYNLGHMERVQRIESALTKWPGLTLAGSAYRGIGIPDCIRSGEMAAQQILMASSKSTHSMEP